MAMASQGMRTGPPPVREDCTTAKGIGGVKTYTFAAVNPTPVLVRGSGDIGSAVAHRLYRAGYRVVLHDVASPAAPRRGMAFTDAIFDGSAVLDGVVGRRVGVDELPGRVDLATIQVVIAGFEDVLAAVAPAVLVDARMRKRAIPEPQRGLAPLTIGLGPNFVAGETTDLVVETRWGERLGTIITDGWWPPSTGRTLSPRWTESSEG